jgi:hypothetical protein
MGFAYEVFVFTNGGSSPCTLVGYPTVTESGPAADSQSSLAPGASSAMGAATAPHYARNGQYNPASIVTLAPGGTASFFMDMQPAIMNGACWGPKGGTPSDVLYVTPPGAALALAIAGAGSFCGDLVPPVSPVFPGVVFTNEQPPVSAVGN